MEAHQGAKREGRGRGQAQVERAAADEALVVEVERGVQRAAGAAGDAERMVPLDWAEFGE
jgi:hypothetical protein